MAAANYGIRGSIFHVFRWPVHCFYSVCVWMKRIIGSLMDPEQKQPPSILPEEECHNTFVQGNRSTSKEVVSEDTVDHPSDKSVLEALEGVSGAIYKICFSKWHCPPEEMKAQPLFKEIDAGIHGIYSNIKDKVRHLEDYEILIAVANALINHLKNFRKKRETYKNYTSQEEADFLRRQTQSLLLYWLPDSLRRSDHILLFLKEIISINVLKPSIDILADPTFINETIVRALAGEEVLKKEDLKLSSAFSESCDIKADGGASSMLESDSITNRKKKKNGFLSKIKGIKSRSKSKKYKEGEECSRFRSYSGTGDEDTMDCTDGLPYTEQMSSDESCEDELVAKVNETVLSKWILENWTATICENPTEDRHTFKICVFKDGSTSTKLWITQRSVKDFRQIYSVICEKYQDLKVFTTLEKKEEAELEDSQFFQAIGTDPETFINTLLELIKVHHNPEPIFFFSPFNYEAREEVSELFSIAFMDTDEDVSAAESETEDAYDENADDPSGSYQSDGCRMFSMKRKNKSKKKSKHGSGSEPEDTCGHNISAITYSEDQALPLIEKKDAAHHMTGRLWKTFGAPKKIGKNSSSVSTAGPSERKEEDNTQKKKLEDTFLNSLYHLVDELFAGGKSVFQFLQSYGFLEQKSKDILAALPKLYAEEQIVLYLNMTSEMLLTDVCPLPVSPDKLPSLAQGLLKSKFQALLPNKIVKYLFERKILKSITACHEAFQKPEANKETVFKILEALTRIITNGSHETRSY